MSPMATTRSCCAGNPAESNNTNATRNAKRRMAIDDPLFADTGKGLLLNRGLDYSVCGRLSAAAIRSLSADFQMSLSAAAYFAESASLPAAFAARDAPNSDHVRPR